MSDTSLYIPYSGLLRMIFTLLTRGCTDVLLDTGFTNDHSLRNEYANGEEASRVLKRTAEYIHEKKERRRSDNARMMHGPIQNCRLGVRY